MCVPAGVMVKSILWLSIDRAAAPVGERAYRATGRAIDGMASQVPPPAIAAPAITAAVGIASRRHSAARGGTRTDFVVTGVETRVAHSFRMNNAVEMSATRARRSLSKHRCTNVRTGGGTSAGRAA